MPSWGLSRMEQQPALMHAEALAMPMPSVSIFRIRQHGKIVHFVQSVISPQPDAAPHCTLRGERLRLGSSTMQTLLLLGNIALAGSTTSGTALNLPVKHHLRKLAVWMNGLASIIVLGMHSVALIMGLARPIPPIDAAQERIRALLSAWPEISVNTASPRPGLCTLWGVPQAERGLRMQVARVGMNRSPILTLAELRAMPSSLSSCGTGRRSVPHVPWDAFVTPATTSFASTHNGQTSRCLQPE